MKKEMRHNNFKLDQVCLDCCDFIKSKIDCKKCGITYLKKVNNRILNDRFVKEIK